MVSNSYFAKDAVSPLLQCLFHSSLGQDYCGIHITKLKVTRIFYASVVEVVTPYQTSLLKAR